jgi:hypothetical protein
MLEFPQPHHLPCPECGATVARGDDEGHECEDERRLDFRVFQLRDEVELFDGELAAWLESPAGRFAAWLAARDR